MPAGAKPGERRGGRGKGSKNKLWSDKTIRILDAEDRLKESIARVLLELQRLALHDQSQAWNADGTLKPFLDWPEDLRRSISGMEIQESEKGVILRKVRFSDKRADRWKLTAFSLGTLWVMYIVTKVWR